MSKYGARKVIVTEDGTIFDMETINKFHLIVEGKIFDSRMEGSYYQELLWMKRDGAIREIECQPVFILQENPKIKYVADFRITFSDGTQIIVDVKGFETPAFRMKAKLFKAKYPDIELRVITKYCGQWMTVAEVKKQKSANKRAFNKLIKQAEKKGQITNERKPKHRTSTSGRRSKPKTV